MQEEYTGRLSDPRMGYFKYVYRDSAEWNPDVGTLEGKTVVVYGEQGYGDVIQFARYLLSLKKRGCEVIFHCQKDLHRLFGCLGVDLLDKDIPKLPPHDYHILSMSLPFALGMQDIDEFPYLKVDEVADLGTESKKIGICWESGPTFTERDCPLKHFRGLDGKLIALQKEIRRASLLEGCEDFELYGHTLNDFYQTATVINALDLVVTVDTSVLHLAGAMGKRTYGLLNSEHDARWDVSTWYPSVKLIKLQTENDWPAAFRAIHGMLRE